MLNAAGRSSSEQADGNYVIVRCHRSSCISMARRRAISVAARVSETMKPFRSV